jgi:PAS domain S-box-containing protein
MRPLQRLAAGLRSWFTASIRRQLILGVVFVHAVLMTIFVFDLVSRQQDFLHEQSLEQARSVAETLATNSVSWVLANDVVGLEEVIGAQAGYPQLEYAMVLDPDGRVLGHSQSRRVGSYLSDNVSRSLLNGPPVFRVVVDSPQLLDVVAPVESNGEHIGWVRIGLDRGAVTAQLQHVTSEGMIYTAAAILIGILFATLLSRGIIAGLNELATVAAKICSGERGRRVTLQRRDEIGSVGKAFNLMLDTIDEEERQRHETQAQLRDAEARVRLLLDSTAEGIIGVDLEGEVVFANRAGVRMLGYDNDSELLGGEIHALINQGRPDGGLAMAAAYSGATGLHQPDARFYCRNGESFAAEYWVAPKRRDGRVIGAVLTFVDITERRRTEEELRRHREQLEELVEERTAELRALNKELEAFSYSVSHDLRAPLRSIHGFSKILINKYQDALDETGQDYLQRVMRASNRMGELIDDLLVLSRVSRSELALEPVDVAELAHTAMDHYQEQVGQQEICFRVSDLPAARADRKLLAVVMDNLLGNALKFSATRPQACIEVGTLEVGGRHAYFVRDNGVGFDMRYADKLFGAFQRLHSVDEFEGTGIGLATVQRIIHRHGGEVWAESELDKGATFYFTLGPSAPITAVYGGVS